MHTLSARMYHMLSMFWKDLFKFWIFALILSIRVRKWWVCFAQGMYQFLRRMLSERISSWCIGSGYASVPDAYAQHVLKVPFQISNVRSVHALVPYAYAQCTQQFLMRVLKVPGAYPQWKQSAQCSKACLVSQSHLINFKTLKWLNAILMTMFNGQL